MASEGLLPHVDVGSGSPVVLLHGFGLDARMWSSQVPALRRGHRVLAPDLPGFGPNGAEAGVSCPADEVFRLLSEKGLGPVNLVGLSYGGAVAVDLLLSHPETVRTLVLVDALLLGERPSIEGWSTCVERAQRGDLAGAREVWLCTKVFEKLHGQAETRGRLREMTDAYRCGHWRGTLETVWKRPEPRPLLEGIRCPTLVLAGETDLQSFKAMAAKYAQTIPGAQLVELAGLGHMGPMEAPERFNTLLLDFLDAQDGGAMLLPSSLRLEFRAWQKGDGPLGMQLWGDARVTSYITAQPFTPSQVEERVLQEVAHQEKHGVHYGPIFLRATGELVGCCGFRPRASPPGVLELGFLLRPQFWGQGLATEAAQAAVEHAFGVLKASAVFAGHHPENSASGHVLRKLGFRQTHLEYYPPTGLDHPSYLLKPEDFRRPYSLP
jgi:[ribosomal protein S5]-alanine N-acetyltransferase